MPTPAPYPTSGNAVPLTWSCDTVPSGQDCAVTSWQIQNDVSTSPSPTVSASPDPSTSAYTGGYNASDTSYGNWSEDWTNFLVGATFALAFCVMIGVLFMHWGRKAMKA